MSRSKGLLLVFAVFSLVTIASAQDATIPADINAADSSQQLLASSGLPIRSRHVVVVMEENRSVTQALQYMPYLKSLALRYGQGMQVYSDSHGSWLAYGELTSGMAPFGGQGDNGICNGDGCSQTIDIDNLVRRFAAQGLTWKGYFQSMPQIGYLGYQSGPYVRRHNPFAFYSDVVNDPAQQANMYPADPYMLQDIQNNNLANFTWISPDLNHDAHDGGSDQQALAAADAYLQTFVPQLLNSLPFQPGGDGVLMVTFDEGELSGDNHCGGNPDPNNCGGHIWQVAIGPQVKRLYQSTTQYKQGSELNLFCSLLGLSRCPGDGATSNGMAEFMLGTSFGCIPAVDHSVQICAPAANGTLGAPVQIVAAARDSSYPITGMVAYANSHIVAQSTGASLNVGVPFTAGQYQLVIRAWDTSGAYFSSQENFSVH